MTSFDEKIKRDLERYKEMKKIINERGIGRSLISKEFIRVFLSEIVDLEGETVNKKI